MLDLYSPLLKKSSLFFSTMGKTLVLEILKETCERNFPSNEAGQQDWEARCKISHHILEQCDLKYHWPTLFSANEWETPWKKNNAKKDCKKSICSLVLVGHGEQVALFNAQLGSSLNDLLHVFDHLLSRSSLPVATEPGDPQKGCVRDVTILWTQSVCGYLRKVYIIYICVCVCVYAYVYIIIYIYTLICVCVCGVLVGHCWFKNLLANYPC